MTLLIVNDVEMTIKFLTTKIDWKKYGISRLFTAYNADEAKEIFRDQEIDIILCDIEMPGENGISLIRWVRSQNFSTEIIFLTCHANFDYIQEALHLDCQDYVLFSQPANKIGEAVQKAVERRQKKYESMQLEEYGRHWLDAHQKSAQEQGADSGSMVDATVSYILENISSPELSVNNIALQNHVSLSYLSRLFRKQKGVTISHFIIDERMKLAGKLLQSGDATINLVALEVGYTNYPYFTSAFKKYYGVTPSEYRDSFPGAKE